MWTDGSKNQTKLIINSKCQKSNFCERISGRTVFKCIEEPASMGACKQRKTESPLDHYTVSVKQHPLNVGSIGYYAIWSHYLLQFMLSLRVKKMN